MEFTGRYRLRLEDNIKIHITEIWLRVTSRFELDQYKAQYRVSCDT